MHIIHTITIYYGPHDLQRPRRGAWNCTAMICRQAGQCRWRCDFYHNNNCTFHGDDLYQSQIAYCAWCALCEIVQQAHGKIMSQASHVSSNMILMISKKYLPIATQVSSQTQYLTLPSEGICPIKVLVLSYILLCKLLQYRVLLL